MVADARTDLRYIVSVTRRTCGHLIFLDTSILSETTMPRLTRYKRFSFAAAQCAQQQSVPLRL